MFHMSVTISQIVFAILFRKNVVYVVSTSVHIRRTTHALCEP